VSGASRLLLLVRAHPTEFAVRLPDRPSGKNGCIAGAARGGATFCVSFPRLILNIEVSEVTSRRERDVFIKFEWQIYANDPVWVPPLIIERKRFLNHKRHPFYKHGDAALFLARKNGKIAGRIMASDDPNYNSLHETNVGCFGLFECIDDQEVAAALFDAAA